MLMRHFLLYPLDYAGLYRACQDSGLAWLHCKAIINWMDISSDSKWHTFGAAVSASYVEHVLNKFHIAEEMQGIVAIFIFG